MNPDWLGGFSPQVPWRREKERNKGKWEKERKREIKGNETKREIKGNETKREREK